MKSKEYVWYCPDEECRQAGVILFKTELPMLDKGNIRCYRCRKHFSFLEIMKANKKNIENFLKKVLK